MTLTTARRTRRAGLRHWYSLGPRVCDWIEEHCVLPSGEDIGEPFRLMPWQREWICDLFTCDAKGNLRYRWALLGIPKKNGKSSLIAALAVYHLLGDPNEPDPWVVVAAASDRQADIVFDACRRMCELSPSLRDATLRYRWEIRPKGGHGKIERVAASAGRLDGKNISLLIIDELHEWTSENWTILTNGTVGRRRSMIVQITTAGFDEESVCYREYEKGQRILSGEADIEAYLFRWYGAPEGADHRDPAVWEAANPSYGSLVSYENLADKVKNVPESQFRRYFLNQWVEAEEIWLPPGAWDACAIESIALDPGTRTYVGWDASTRHDSTAIVTVQDQGGVKCVLSRVWSRPLDPNGNPVEDWRLPIVECEAYIRELCERYNVVGVAYDPAFITWSADELEAQGLPMEEWAQTPSRMCPATAAFYEIVVQGELAHDGDPVLARHVRSVKARSMRQGGQMLEKKDRGKQIDAAIALVMAVGLLKVDEGEEWHGIYLGEAT